MLTTDVENFPFPTDPRPGSDGHSEQAERFGAEFVTADADSVDFSGPELRTHVAGTYTSRSIIISTGAARMLDSSPSTAARSRVSTCATCDGFFFRGHEIAVIGGGDSALEEANFLTVSPTR
jgi:thioredoxin reductase (NADPH)